jgi:2-oxoisovalerate dehydrogenase E2 component (dihydrolipoyl transacylase)
MAMAKHQVQRVARLHVASQQAFHSHASFQKKIVSFPLADIGEGIAEVEVLEWYVKEGDEVEEFAKLCQVQSDKATVDISSKYKGTVVKVYYKQHEIAQVGQALVDIRLHSSDSDLVDATPTADVAKAEQTQTTNNNTTNTNTNTTTSGSGAKFLMTPAVRRIVKENNIDLNNVQASGKNNRVLKEDVQRFMDTPTPQKPTTPTTPIPTPPTPTPTTSTTSTTGARVEVIRGMRKAMVKSMTAALKIPHFGYADEIEMNKLVELRN